MSDMNHKTFTLAWVEAYSKKLGVQSVAQRFDITIPKASAKANYLRKQGVNLPAMPRARRSGHTIEELNELIASKI